MKNKTIILFVLFLINVSFVLSATYNLEVSWDNYFDTNTYENIIAYPYVNDGILTDNNTYTVYFTDLTDNSSTEMLWNVEDNLYSLVTNSTDEDDVPFRISLRNQGGDNISYYNYTGVMKFRDSFYVTIVLWKKGSNTSTFAEKYENRFAYIVLQNWTTAFKNPVLDMSYLDKGFSWLPLYGALGTTKLPKVIDVTESFWAPINNGEAKIKMYEYGNYSIYLLSEDVQNNITWPYEFIFPQTDHTKYKGMLTDKMSPITISSETDQTWDIYFSIWEVNKLDFAFEIGKYIILALIWVIGIIVIANVPGGLKGAIAFATAYWPVVALLGWL